jgi:hypothetical protein
LRRLELWGRQDVFCDFQKFRPKTLDFIGLMW